jgi:hypothetical protein
MFAHGLIAVPFVSVLIGRPIRRVVRRCPYPRQDSVA